MLAPGKLFNPTHQEFYKIIIRQVDMNLLVKEKFLPEQNDIKRINFKILKNKIHIKGILNNPKSVKNAKKQNLSLDVILRKEDFSRYKFIFFIEVFKIYYPLIKVDFLRILNKYTNLVKKRTMTLLTKGDSPFCVVQKYDQISFNLEHILRKIPSLVSLFDEMKIKDINFEKHQIVCFISSSLMFKALIHILGTRYLSIEQINPHVDPVRSITHFFLDQSR